MRAQIVSLIVSIVLGSATSCTSAPGFPTQSPGQPGRLAVNSTPPGARITVNGKDLNQQTDATFVLPSGKYSIAVSSGTLNCPSREVTVTSGQQTTVHCSSGGWD